jgi:Protein of unknown function (DUF1217)
LPEAWQAPSKADAGWWSVSPETRAVLSTNASFKLLTNNLAKTVERIGKAPEVKRETEYYLKTIGSIKTMDAFLANDRVYTYAMKAFGLNDMVYAKAFVRKVLTDGVDTAQSFANLLADPRFRELALTFNFKSTGATTTIFDKAQKGVVDKYMQVKLEENAGADNEGVRLALYFKRKAPEITSAYSILADPALLKVAQVALSLPAASSAASIEKQAELIKSKLNVDKIDQPAELTKFLDRFTTLWELKNSSAAASLSAGVESLTSTDTLMKIQSLRTGGRS